MNPDWSDLDAGLFEEERVEEVARNGSEPRGEDDETRRVALVRASEVTAERIRWVHAGRIPMGAVTIIAGRQGLGKSTYTIAVSAQATRGRLHGDLRGHPADVVYASAEDHRAAVLRPRFEAAGADLDRVHFVTVEGLGSDELSLPGDLASLATEVGRVGARILVLDPVVAHLPLALDAHKDQHVRQALAPLARLAEKHRLAVVALMHLNKAAGMDVLDRVSGSIAFTAAARSVLAVGKDPDDESTCLVIQAKPNLAPAGLPAIRFKVETRFVPDPRGDEPIETAGIAWLGEVDGVHSSAILRASGGEEERSEQAEATDRAREVLASGPRDAREAERIVGASHSTFKRVRKTLGIVSELQRDPSTGRVTGWLLSLPPRGPSPEAQTPAEPLEPLAPTRGFVPSECPEAHVPKVGPLEASGGRLEEP